MISWMQRHFDPRSRGVRTALVCLTLLLVGSWNAGLPAAEGDKPEKAEAAPRKSPLEGLQLQETDEPLTALVPERPRTVTEQDRIEALSWFGTGRVLEARNDISGAYAAYQKAAARDPNSWEILEAIIPLAFNLNQTEDGLKYALRAVELRPDDHRMLRRMGALLINTGDPAGAMKFFEQAVKSPKLDKHSPLYVTLMRDLGALYRAVGREKDAANCYEVVFDALQNHAKYGLDSRTRKELLADPEVDYEKLGQVFLAAERSELAIQAFQKAAQVRKAHAANLSFNLARVYLQTKQPDKALEELQKYFDAQRQAKGPAAYQLLVDILKEQGKADQAIPRLEDLAEKDSRNSMLQFFLADEYARAGQLEKAETLYKKTLSWDPDMQGYAGLADVYRRQMRPADLLEQLTRIYTKSKQIAADGRGVPARGRAAEGDRQPPENLPALRLAEELKAIKSDPKLVDGLLEVGRKLAKGDKAPDFATSYVLASIAAEADRSEAAEEFFRLAIAARRDQAADVYEELGRHLMGLHKYGDAARIYQEAARSPDLADNRPTLLYLLAQALELNDDTKGALAANAEARKDLPNHPLLQYQEGWIYSHARQFDEAIRVFEKIITTFPDNREIVRRSQSNLSNVYVQQGDIRKGEEILEVMYKADPNDVSVNNDLGYLYADQGKNLEQAESMIAKALKTEPDNIAYLDSMGWVLYKQGKYAEALPYLVKATAGKEGVDGTLWDHLADVYERLNQTGKALESWKKALEVTQKGQNVDEKFVGRLEEKIKNHTAGAGKLKSENPNSP